MKLMLFIKTSKKQNPNKKCEILIIFDDMIADMLGNKKFNPVVTKLFIRGRKSNISLDFIAQIYFAVPKNIRLQAFIMKIPSKREFQQIAFNLSSDIDFKDLMYLYNKCIIKPYSFLVIDATLASDNPLRFRKNILDRI